MTNVPGDKRESLRRDKISADNCRRTLSICLGAKSMEMPQGS